MVEEVKAKFKEINDKIIFKCPECPQKLRLPLFKTKKLTVKCPKCNFEFIFNYKKYHFKRKTLKLLSIISVCSLVSITLAAPIISIAKIEENLKSLKSKQTVLIKEFKDNSEKEISTLANEYQTKISAIDNDKYRSELQQKAANYYEQIWNERKNFNARYAITPREKAQLEMLRLSQDTSKRLEDVVRGVAIMASPRNSTINVYHVSDGLRLDIDFDMSELTSGEFGTRTKHDTIGSLKKEVIKLISKVTNDVYNFCQDLDLSIIAIGCRHYVNYEYSYGSSRDENVVVYKIKLNKKDLKKLENNPFLDTYSTTNYFQVEKDDFPNLRITREL